MVDDPMFQTREHIQAERARLRAEYRPLYDQLTALLFHLDPVGINHEQNTDEYEPEVGTILPRLGHCQSESDVCRVVHEEFVKWFGEDTAGPQARYVSVAAEIWPLWLGFKMA